MLKPQIMVNKCRKKYNVKVFPKQVAWTLHNEGVTQKPDTLCLILKSLKKY